MAPFLLIPLRMNAWQPQPTHRPDTHNVITGVLIALAVVGAALTLITGLDRRDLREPAGLTAALGELHDARVELQASAEQLRSATSTLQEAAHTLERRATMVNILDIVPPPAVPAARREIDLAAAYPFLRCSEPGRCAIARSDLARLLADPSELAHQARVMPSVRDGQPRGFKIYGVRNASLPRALGFKNGDLMTAINGHDLTNVDSALGLFEKLRRADELRLSIDRKGQAVLLTLKID